MGWKLDRLFLIWFMVIGGLPSFAGADAPVSLVRSPECAVCADDRDACNAGCSSLTGHALVGCNQNCRSALQACEERHDCRTSTSSAARRLALLETGVSGVLSPGFDLPSP